MNRLPLRISVAAMCVIAACAQTVMAQLSFDGKTDIGRLLSTARQRFDTGKEDAVVLLNKQAVRWHEDGRMSVFVHRIIWVNSGVTIDEYGDIRVPYDHERCRFVPLAVRVWRDGQWWPSDSTGIVETLPFALDQAYDYTGIRDMMLLLNGMEIPCIAEIAYRIEDRTPYRRGADGLWLFQTSDPTVESRFELTVPSNLKSQSLATVGVPAPQMYADSTRGLMTTSWQMGPSPALPRPHTADPATDVPHVQWSTWGSWEALGAFILEGFRRDTADSPRLLCTVDSLLRDGKTDRNRATKIAAFLKDNVTYINYPASFWWTSARSSDQTYSTAYGHGLDYAILAARLLKKGGLVVHPVFVSRDVVPLDTQVPSLEQYGGPALLVKGANFEAVYRPENGDFVDLSTASAGRTIWQPDVDLNPRYQRTVQGSMSIRLSLAYDKDKAMFVGSGFLEADSGLCPYGQLTGLKDEMTEYLGDLLTALLKGATVSDYSSELISPSAVVVGFGIELAKPTPDDLNRTVLTFGKPIGGVLDHMPSDVQLVHEDRESSIRLPFVMRQRLEMTLDLRAAKALYYPAAETITNAAGSFTVTSSIRDSQLTVVRELSLSRDVYPSSDWPLLRSLLLADQSEKNRLIILKL